MRRLSFGPRSMSGLWRGRLLLLGLLATVASLLFASGALASGPLIVGNNANFGGGPIQTYDFSTGGAPVASFVPTGASDRNNGRGLEVIGSEVFYTELSGGFGATPSIEVAPYNGGAGGADTRTLANPRPGVGIQDLAASGGFLYVLTGYSFSPLQVFKLDPSSGAVLAGPISIAGPASPSSDGFTVLPNGNFLINDRDGSCTYNQYDGSTGALVPGTTISVPGAGACTGVDNDGTSLFFQTDFSSFTQTDMSGNLIARKTVSGELGIEDISLIQPSTTTDQSITATGGFSFTGTEPKSISNGTVATFTDPDTSAKASDYSATIDWGDGSASTSGTITGSNGSFTVTGSHTYNDEGSHTITVTITDTDNASNTATAKDSASISDAALHAAGAAPAVSPQSFNGPVATFTDDNSTTSSTADFTATIDWGDGSPTSSGTVSGSGGSYTVSGSHSYTGTGYFTIKVHIVDDGGSTADASSKVLIFGISSGGNFGIGDKNSAVGTSVTFWGAQWWKLNSLTGGAAPASFKGFEDTPSSVSCGTSWTTDPGNSTPPPAGPLPAYMAVIVSSQISKSGSTISGNTLHMVVVKTNPGYAPDPGHPGTGTVVAPIC